MTARGRRARAALVAASLSAAPVAATAAAPGPGEGGSDAVAETQYRQGATAYASGRYAEAIDRFRMADRLRPSAALSFNIARAYERLGDTPSTLAWYRDYLRRAPASDDAGAVQGEVTALEGELARRGVQQVTVLSQPRGATILLDGQPVGVTPWTGELAPGAHALSLRLRGHADVEQTFLLPREEALDVTATLAAREDASQPAGAFEVASPESRDREPDAPRARPARTWGFVGLGAGAAAFGGALAFELMRRSAASEAEHEAEQVRAAEQLDTANSRARTARVLAGAGAVLAATGVVLLVVDAHEQPEDTRLAVGCLPGVCAATATGTFW